MGEKMTQKKEIKLNLSRHFFDFIFLLFNTYIIYVTWLLVLKMSPTTIKHIDMLHRDSKVFAMLLAMDIVIYGCLQVIYLKQKTK